MKPSKFLKKIVDLTEKQLEKKNIQNDYVIYWDVDDDKHPILEIVYPNNVDITKRYDLEEYRIRQNEEDISVKDIFKSSIKPIIIGDIQRFRGERVTPAPEQPTLVASLTENNDTQIPVQEEIHNERASLINRRRDSIIPFFVPENWNYVEQYLHDTGETIFTQGYAPGINICYNILNDNDEWEPITLDLISENYINSTEVEQYALENISESHYALFDICQMFGFDICKSLSEDNFYVRVFHSDEMPDPYKSNPAMVLLDDNPLNPVIKETKENSYIVFPTNKDAIFISKDENIKAILKEMMDDIYSDINENDLLSKNIYEFNAETNSLDIVDIDNQLTNDYLSQDELPFE